MELLESALEDIPDSKLPSFLYKVHRQLRSTHDSTFVKKLLSLPPEEESASDAPGSTFIQTLLSFRFLFSTNSEVAHLVGCILCDVIRLGSPSSEQEKRKPSSQISLPFPTSKCTEVLRCIAQPLKEAARLADLPNQAGLIAERASSCRVMALLLPYCDPGEVECLVSPFFGLLEAPLLVPSSSPVSTLSASLSENLSQILLDIIHASSNSITAAQLSLLLTAVVRASPALRNGNGVLSSTLFTSLERSGNGSDKNYDTATFSAMTAGRVLSECLEVVQDALNDMVMKHLTNVLTVKAGTDSYDLTSFIPSAVEEKDHLLSEHSPIPREDRLTAGGSDGAATTAGGVKNSTSRRLHFYQISKHLEYFVAMIELNVNFVQILLPNLQALLNHDDGDFRRLLLRSLGMGYSSHPLAIPTYRSFFENFLEHVDDVKLQIRVEMIQFVSLIVEKARREWLGHSPWGRVRLISPMMSHHSPVATKKEEFEEWDLWEVLMSAVVQRLLDPIFSVRLQAVSTLSVCVEKSPELLRLGKLDLERTLGLRIADKNPKVRDATLDHLCKLYRASPETFSWVPSILFTTVSMDDDVKVVEVVLEMLMLPSSDGKGATEEGAFDPQRVAGSNSSMRVEMPLFRFEDTRNPSNISKDKGTTHPCDDVDINDDLLLPSPTVQHSTYSRYLERWCRLCDSISPSMFRELVGIAKKKSLLRSTVTKLFELREVAQQSSRSGMDAEADESAVSNRSSVVESKQRIVHNVHRLLTFLQTATGAKKNEWNALFRCRDKKVVQAILRFCQHSNEEWEAERLELLLTIKGRVDVDTYAFVKDRLVKMLSFPFQLQHLSGLLECLRMASTGQKRIATSTGVLSLFIRADDAGKHLTIPCTVLIRVLQIFLLASPSYYRRCCSTIADIIFQLVLDSAICEGKASSYFSSFSDILTFVESLLHCLKELPVALRYLTTGERAASSTLCKVLMDSQKSLLLDTLKALCTGSAPLLTYAGEQLSQHLLKEEDVKALSSIFKNAALCLLSLVNAATPSAGDERPIGMVGEDKTAEMAAIVVEKEAIAQLAQDVLRSLQHSAFLGGSSGKVSVTKTKEIEGTSPTALLAWLQTLRVWSSKSSVVSSKSPTPHSTLSPSLSPDTGTWTLPLPPTLQKSIGDVLLTVCHLYSTPVLEKQQRKKSGERAEKERHPLLHCADVLVDCAAKTLSAVTLSSPSSERVDQFRQALNILLEAFRILRSVEGEEIGGSTTHDALQEQTGSSLIVARLAILQQLAKLVRLPSSDMVKEIGVAVVLSLEENPSIRRVLQEKFAKQILHSTCDMRYVTFLLLLAIPAANKSEYHELRVVVQKVGAHLRKKQLGSDSGASVSLSSPAAMSCYLEYTIPFIVLFLSRHPHYEMQRDKLHFIGFQRVWHLIFEELLSHGIQCISFVKELLFRIKQAKDALQPDGIRTKVLSDLGSSVLEQLLSQYKIGTDALKRYPGKLLLPNFFISPSSRDPASSSLSVAQTSYLDSSLHVSIHVPFRLPFPGVSPSPTVDAPGEARISPASSKEGTFPLTTGVTAPASSTPPSKRRREEPFEEAPKEVPQAIHGRDARYFGESELPCSFERMHERMLDEVLYLLRQRTAGLTKSDIALIRWNEIKKDVAQICSEKQYATTVIDGEQKINPDGHFPNSSASLLENLLDFSKKKLKELYAQAKD